MKRIVTLLHASVFLILLAAISGNAAMQEDNRNFYRLNQALYDISNFYLDTVNQAELTDKAIAAMVAALDPHSTYIPADQVKEMNEPLVGNFDNHKRYSDSSIRNTGRPVGKGRHKKR